MSNAQRLNGQSAIDYAIATERLLNKYADPTEEGREGLTVEEAQEIAQIDPSLIWIEVEIVASSEGLALWAASAEGA